MNRIFYFLLLSFAFPTFAENQIIEGSFENLPYRFTLNNEWDDVQGSWGDQEFHLGWDKEYKQMKGKTAGIEKEFEINTFTSQILGSVTCGFINLNFKRLTNGSIQVTGSICSREYNSSLLSKKDFKLWLRNHVLSETVLEFPPSTREIVMEFFYSRLEF